MNNSPEEIMKRVFEGANSTGLFKPEAIKVRINPYMYYNVGNVIRSFIYITVSLLEGRSREQKDQLTQKVVAELEEMLPDILSISLSFVDLDRETYFTRTMPV